MSYLIVICFVLYIESIYVAEKICIFLNSFSFFVYIYNLGSRAKYSIYEPISLFKCIFFCRNLLITGTQELRLCIKW